MHVKRNFADLFINPSHNKNNQKYHQARMLVSVCLLTTCISFSYFFISYFYGFEKGMYMMALNVIGFLSVALLVKTRLNLYFLSNSYIAIGAIAIYYLIYYTGGLSSPVVLWLVAAPVLAFLVANRLSAITWGLVLFISVLVFSFIEVYDLKPPSELPVEFSHIANMAVLIGLMLIIFIVTMIFENEKNNALQDIDRKNRELTSALVELKSAKARLTKTNYEIQTKNTILESNQLEILKQSDQLKILNEEKDYIIEVLAHDLKEPLNSVEGLIDLILKDENVLSSNQQECIDHIQKTILKSRLLLAKILFSGEVENRTLSVKWEKINASEILRHTMDSFAKQARDKNIIIEHNINDGAVQLVTDEVLLTQIFQNILSNSIKYSPKNSKVTVHVEQLEQTVKFEFKDQGPGIAENELEKLFDKYSRLSARPTAGESSTGLGLSLVKKYVEMLNGKIWYENRKSLGANFIVLLPVKP